MSAKDTVEQLIKALEAQEWQTAATLLSDDFAEGGTLPGEAQSREDYLTAQKAIATAFPDWHYTVSDVQEQGNTVTLWLAGSGTHTGELVPPIPAMPAIPASGKLVTLPADHAEFMLKGGQITALRLETPLGGGLDGILEQIGAVPLMEMGGQ